MRSRLRVLPETTLFEKLLGSRDGCVRCFGLDADHDPMFIGQDVLNGVFRHEVFSCGWCE